MKLPMEDVSPKYSTLYFSKKFPGGLLFQAVKLPQYFQDAKYERKKPSLSMYTLLQNVSGLQDIHIPPKNTNYLQGNEKKIFFKP